MAKFILNCALTGAVHTPSMAPYLPLKPKDIAQQAIDAANAGASTVHVHARNPETGIPTGDLKIMGDIVSTIHARSNAVICISTGGSPTMTVDERICAVPAFKPELASCNLGSINFGLFPMLEQRKGKEWKYDWEEGYYESTRDYVFKNTFADLDRILEVFKETGTKPELEAYDIGHLHTAKFYSSAGKIAEPPYFQYVMGILGGITPTIPHLLHMKQTCDTLFGANKYVFSTIGAGREEFPLGTVSMLMGGAVRVGMEDNVYLSKGVYAKSNAELVEKMIRIARELGFEPATPDEARQILKLKGKSGVNM
jgi:uncharacterized protein (DUF849 family)